MKILSSLNNTKSRDPCGFVNEMFKHDNVFCILLSLAYRYHSEIDTDM